MIGISSASSLVALATLCTVVYIGLGFLPRPSRAAAVWSFAFVGAMIAGYLWAAADTADLGWLRGLATGVMLGMLALLWVGLRVRRRASRWHWVPTVLFIVAAPLTLTLTADAEGYLTVVRVAFAVSAVFSVLTVIELVRLGPLLRDEAMPLTLMSTLSAVFSALGLVQEAVRLASDLPAQNALEATRNINALGAELYLVAAMVTLLLLTRHSARAPRAADSPAFDTVAADRLSRAEVAGDRWWSVLVVRLDEPEALRDASSTNAFDQMTENFAADVRRALPAEADIAVRSATEVVALVPRPEGAVRQVLATVLAQVADGGTNSPLAVRLSASIGWAPVDTIGYGLAALVAAASTAADRAQAHGGDQWDRAAAASLD